MSSTADKELNKAALVIAKLLIRTHEGKIKWSKETLRSVAAALKGSERYKARLEDSIDAVLTRGVTALGFDLIAHPAAEAASSELSEAVGNSECKILSISLPNSFGREEERTPESIVYRDLKELFDLAEDPNSLSKDLKLKQVMSYLDRIAG